ncbi:hypothetical protein PMAYCL1PPCAC_04006, partial [Pristionchus mayeri]
NMATGKPDGSPLVKRFKRSEGNPAESDDTGEELGGESALPIEQLPQELIRLIVGYLPWKTNRRLRAGLPGTTVKIMIPRINQELFELRLASQAEFFVENNIVVNEQFIYLFYDTMDKHSILLDHLINCVGKSIVEFAIRSSFLHSPSPVQRDPLVKILQEIRFRSLDISNVDIDDEFANVLEEYAFPNIDMISIEARWMSLSDPRTFLLKISSNVRFVYLSMIVHYINLPDFDYVELIAQMFSNKMDTLELTSLPRGHINLLRERLPCLGKKIWFSTESSIDNLNYTINEHRVKADGRHLTIKHISRLSEHY